MKRLLLVIAVLLTAAGAAQAADVGVSISIGQPGFYGRLDVGDFPRPEVVYVRPVTVHPAPVHVVHQPVYMHVPPGHQKKWSKHCSKYNACDRPVYFVKDRWYNKVYAPQYQARHIRQQDGRYDGRHNGGPDKHNGKHDKRH